MALLPLIQSQLQELSLLQTKWKALLDPILSSGPLQFNSYTPTIIGAGSVNYLGAFWAQLGKIILVYASWQNGTIGTTSYPSVSLPNNSLIDPKRVSSGNSLVGIGWQGPTTSSAGTASQTLYAYPLPVPAGTLSQVSSSSVLLTSKFSGISTTPGWAAYNPLSSNSNVVLLFGVPVQ